jgi:hypothetical protein
VTHRALVPVVFALLAACAHAGARRRATLSELGAEIRLVRSERSDAPASLPDVTVLVGAPRAQLTAALGHARTCGYPVEPPCARPGEVLWTFSRNDAGPHLAVTLGPDGRVVAARWREARTAWRTPAPPP